MGRHTTDPGPLEVGIAIRTALMVARAESQLEVAAALQVLLEDLPRTLSQGGPKPGHL